jgi:hypothetical protein
MPKDKNEAIKKGLYAEKPLPKEIIIPDTIACDIKDPNKKAENCGSFVKIVLSNNGIETTKSNWMGDIYNSLNEANPQGKILHVYDFDDTIARVKANIKVYITSPNGEYNKELSIPAEKFPEESKELEARLGNLEIEYDFKEFEKQIGDAIVNAGVVNKLKNSLSKPNIKTTILTARSIGHPVTKYLREELGLAAYVVPLGLQVGGKVTGQDKANWIENHINKGYNTIYFIDDSEENRVAVEALKDKYPDTKITVENPYEVSEMMMGMMNKQEKAKHAKNMKRLSKDMSNMKGNNYGGGGYKVPDYVKGTLTRKLSEIIPGTLTDLSKEPGDVWQLFFSQKWAAIGPQGFRMSYKNKKHAKIWAKTGKDHLGNDEDELKQDPFQDPELVYEMEDYELKYWALYADLVKKLDAPDAEETYARLRPELTGEKQKALDYFYHTYFKEDSPEKLEENALTKEWWKKIINKVLITEGGAAGHMNHPFDDRDLTFAEMKELVNLSLQGKLNIEADVTEKTDGQNLAVTYKNGKVGAARNKATIRKPMDINAVASKFEGRGDIEKAFTFSMRDLENALKTLAPETLNTIFQNGKRFLNIEIIYPATKNVITYGPKAYIQFHGVDEFNLETATKEKSYPEFAPELQKLIAGVNANIQQTFEIIPPKIITTKAVRDFDQKESYYINKINKLQKEFNLKDFDEVVMYHQKWWEKKINEEFPRATDEEKNALVRRWAYFEKTFRLRKIQDEETRQKAIDFDKTNFQQQNKENVYQFEKIFLELGTDVLSNIDNYLAVNPKESVKELRQDIQKVIKQIQSSNDLEVLNKLKYQLKRIEDMGGFDKLVPSEGIVFIYKGKTYKITGLFAAVNQLLGLTRYV